jgi:hypothetical protein
MSWTSATSPCRLGEQRHAAFGRVAAVADLPFGMDVPSDGTRVVPPPESGEEDETVGTRFGLAALHDSTHKGRLACVLEIVGDHADQPHAQRHRRIP